MISELVLAAWAEAFSKVLGKGYVIGIFPEVGEIHISKNKKGVRLQAIENPLRFVLQTRGGVGISTYSHYALENPDHVESLSVQVEYYLHKMGD